MTTPKVHVPQPAIFQSDPTEQIALRDTLNNRDMSGLSYMFLNAMGNKREQGQQDYMAGVQQANRIAAALEQQDMMSKQAIEVLKQAVEMSKTVGSPTDTMPIMRMLFPSGVADPGAAAKLALINSETNANNAKAAASGREGQDQSEVRVIADPQGPGVVEYKYKGRGDPNGLAAKAEAAAIRDKLARLKGGPLSLNTDRNQPYVMSPIMQQMINQR